VGRPHEELRLSAARRWSNRLVRILATGAGGALLLVALFVARRSPVSGAVVGIAAIGLLVLTWVPLRLPSPPALSRDPDRPGVLLPGSRAHPWLVAGLAAVLVLFVLVTGLPVVALLRDPSLETSVLVAVGVLACTMVGVNLHAVRRPGRSLVVGPDGLSLPELGGDTVTWDQIRAVEVSADYLRRGIPRHVPVVILLLRLPGRGQATYRLDPVDLGPDPARTLDVLGRLRRGSADRAVLGTPDALDLFGTSRPS